MEYLLELRKRLLLCLGFTLIVFVGLCFFANPIYLMLTKPLLKQLPSAHLIATQITTPFLIPIKFVFIVSLIALIPFFFYHLWAFISPALYAKEKSTVWLLLLPSVFLFYTGFFFAYFIVLPTIFRFFIATTPVQVHLLPDMAHYLSFSLKILFAFGLAFQVPIIVMALILLNIVSREQLVSARRYVIVLSFIIGMIFTPPDIFSQILLAIPIWLLYELGLFLARFIKRRNSDIG
jgi:sec-independent protein translocase protein TatC